MTTIQNLFRCILALCCLQLVPALAWAQGDSPITDTPRPKYNKFETEDEYERDAWDFGENDSYGQSYNPIIIDSETSLMNLVYNVNYRGKTYKGVHFKLTKDLVINRELLTEDGLGKKTDADRPNLPLLTNWWPIGRYGTFIDDYFAGCFDGDGHTITGLFLDNGYEPNDDTDMAKYIGLFGKIKNATIKNLTLRECYMGNSNGRRPQATHYGALVGYAAGTCTIENCHVEKSLYETICDLKMGGLVGYLESGSITNCTFNATLINQVGGQHFDENDYWGNIHYGAIVGEVKSGLVENCHAIGTVAFNTVAFASGYFTIELGGICGLNKGLVKACSSNLTYKLFKNNKYFTENDRLTTTKSNFRIGGVAGINEGTIQECVAKGQFSVGYHWGNKGYPSAHLFISGIANLARGGVIEDCANFTNLTVDETFSDQSTFAGIGQRNWEGDSKEKAAIRRCISVCNHMNDGNLDKYENENGWTNKFRYAAIAAPDDYLTIENCYAYNTKENTTLLDKEVKAVTSYPTLSDVQSQNPFNNTGVWGTWPTSDDSEYAQCPLPIAVGGEVTGLRGAGTEQDPFLIANAAELNKAADLINDVGGTYDRAYYKLEADILMGSTALRAIGLSKKPFRGTFDGAGHYISNLITKDGYMFGFLYGTVKNLSLVDCKGSIGGNEFAGIVFELGDNTKGNKGLVSNCYVGADVHLYREQIQVSIETLRAAGICLRLKSSGTIENCYVVGNFIFEGRTVDGQEPGITSHHSVYADLGGIVHYSFGGTIRNCYAVTNHEVDGEVDVWKNPNSDYIRTVGLVYELHSGTTTTIDNCRYYNPQVSQPVKFNENGTDLSTATSVASEAELANYFNAAPWKRGYYRPVLEGTKIYAATTPEGNETYLDAIPTKPTQPNYFLKVNLSPSDFNSDFLEKFQGVAFYSSSQNSDYLLNWNIDPEADWQYVPTEGATVKGHASLTLHRSESNNGNGWFWLCLPGEVYLSDLPTGSKVYVLGAVNESAHVANMVEVKTIPAGVPFLLYLPKKVTVSNTDSNGKTTTTEQTVENVPLIMEGEFVTATSRSAENSALSGTDNFKGKTLENVCNTLNETTDGENPTRTAVFASSAEVKPFAAYINYTADVELADYLLLDENDPRLNDLITSNDGKTVRVKLLRKLKAGQWNTLCLPFKAKGEQIKTMFGENTVVNYYYYYSNHQDGTMTIEFKNFDFGSFEVGGVTHYLQDSHIGCPYLIKPEKVQENGIYDFGEVTISTSLNEYFHEKHPDQNYFRGTFAPTELRSTKDRYTYFIQGDHIYFIPLSEMVPMLGFRGYFNFPVSLLGWDSSSAAPVQEFIIQYGDGTTTRIKPEPLAPSAEKPAAVYDLQGRRLAHPGAKGVYIIGNKKIIK